MRQIYISTLIKMINCLSDKEIQRIYRLAEYLYIHRKGVRYEIN